MKTFRKFLALFFLGLTVLSVSCDDNRLVNDLTSSSNVTSNSRLDTEKIDYEDEGNFIYQTLKFHSAHFDPYTLIPEKDRDYFKSKIDSVKIRKISDPEVIWDKYVSEKKITDKTYKKLKKFKTNALNFIISNTNADDVDKWFVNDIENAKQDKNLDFKEKDFYIHHATSMRYAIRAYLETNISSQKLKDGRMSANCTLEMVSCIWGNISTYQGIGAFVGAVGAVGTTTTIASGGAVGALLGALIGVSTCTCDEASCAYPKLISTPDKCYNQFYGIDFVSSGFGASTNFLRWFFYEPNGNQFLMRDTNVNSVHVYNSDLGGRTDFMVSVVAYCDGLSYPTQTVRFDISSLGKPIFFLSGNTYPTVGTQQFYSISGRNLNTVTWGLNTSIGQVLSQNSYGLNVQWNSTGYSYLYANAQSDCGSTNNGLNVVVHN